MAERMKIIDVSETPELLRLAEEVDRSYEPYILRREGKDLAEVRPVGGSVAKQRSGRTKTAADYEAFRRAAGS
jgi:hypothetical protein